MSTRIHIVVSDEVLERIDAVLGEVPRSVWIRNAMMTRLIEAEHDVGGPVSGEASDPAPGAPGRALSPHGVRGRERRAPRPDSSGLVEPVRAATPFRGQPGPDVSRIRPRTHAPTCKCAVCTS